MFLLETNIHQDPKWQDENRKPSSQHEEEQGSSDHSMWVNFEMHIKKIPAQLCDGCEMRIFSIVII